ncbi:MAG: T9SS type A sorting domain-containing protein [Bacteroidales bacterium]|nr:T9SS type A sorting domain-containing protein [Bacteroidales bacterium]
MKKILLALCALCMTVLTQGQIVYTNLPTPVEIATDYPDELGYEINFAGGYGEFYIQNYGSYGEPSYIACFEAGTGIVSNTNNEVTLLAQNTVISSTSNFYENTGGPVFPIIHATDYTAWVGQTGYAGFKYKNGTNTHYGWIKLKVTTTPTNPTITIYSYAYNSTANQQIIAGQTTLGLEDINNVENIKVYPTLCSNSINIEGAKNTESIAIFDILGKKVMEINSNTNQIDVSSLNPNTYFIRISADNKVTQRKFIKQ